MDEITYEDPPHQSRRNSTNSKWAGIKEELKRTGKWGKFEQFSTQSSASVRCTQLKSSGFEAVTRGNILYVRWPGPLSTWPGPLTTDQTEGEQQ